MKKNEFNTNAERDIFDPATWTDEDRYFIDTVRKLTTEEQQFLIDFILFIEEQEPARRELMAQFAEDNAKNYRLRTIEGQESFMAALSQI